MISAEAAMQGDQATPLAEDSLSGVVLSSYCLA